MADVQDANAGAEPSMEEILASIRRIIADEKDGGDDATGTPPAEDTAEGDALELTQVVQEDGSVGDITSVDPVPSVEEPPPPPAPEPLPVVETASVVEPALSDEPLVSAGVADVAASALSALSHTLEAEKKIGPTSLSPLGDGAKTLEDMVMELMRPLLKAWLDENLPPIVDRIVQKEVERIARRI